MLVSVLTCASSFTLMAGHWPTKCFILCSNNPSGIPVLHSDNI